MTTKSTTVPGSLFASFAHDAQERAAKHDAEVAEATTRYWAIVDRLTSGDESGGVSRRDFAGILEVLGFDLDRARSDIARVQRIRQTRTAADAAEKEVRSAEAASGEARAEWQRATDALEQARIANERRSWQASEAGEELTRLRLLIRDELRGSELALRTAGFKGELLAPVPPPPPRRRWRFRNGADATLYADLGPGRYLEDESEVDMPADFCGYPPDGFGRAWTTLVGVVTPDMPPPKQKLRAVVPEGQRAGERAEDMSALNPNAAGV